MKKVLVILVFTAFGMISCLKNKNNDCIPVEVNTKGADAEVNALRGYLIGNGISTQEDPRGFFYIMTTTGTGTKPNTCSAVSLSYAARLLNGTLVDTNSILSYPVKSFITGWQEALPLVANGGNMTLYLPPSLAYGADSVTNTPPNSNLVFTIKLNNVQ